MSAIEIRPATVEDASVIAAVHVACWRETYEGIAPAELLAELSVDERADYWRARMKEEGRPSVYLALAEDGSAAGFAACGPQQSAVLARSGYSGEISALYLLKSAQRQGAGRRLMRLMAEELRGRGFEWAGLWVLRHNFPARRFYEKLGGRKIGVEGMWSGVPEVAYGWRDLGRLLDAHQ